MRFHTLWVMLSMFLAMLLILLFIFIADQFKQDIATQNRVAERELKQIASLIRTDLQRGEYQHVSQLMLEWGRANNRIVKMQLTAMNGFVISDYNSGAGSFYTLELSSEINYSYRGIVSLKVVKDLAEVYERRNVLAWQLGGAYVVLAVLLSALTHSLILSRQKSRALELEIERRQQAEQALTQERDHLEKTVSTRTAELTSTNRELEAFSYSVSHDLRAPLRAIDGFSLALLEDYGTRFDDVGRDYLFRIRNGAQKMGRLIDELLQLSRVTRSTLERRDVDLSALVEDVVRELQRHEPDRNVKVVVAPGLRTWGDPLLLHVLLTNLLSNAWKFTRGQSQPIIEFAKQEKNGMPAFFIRDNGAGFDMQYAHKLFIAFQRLHGLDQFEGTGIGLATVQRIIAKHGGCIWAEGTVGEGATFYFTLPSNAELKAGGEMRCSPDNVTQLKVNENSKRGYAA